MASNLDRRRRAAQAELPSFDTVRRLLRTRRSEKDRPGPEGEALGVGDSLPCTASGCSARTGAPCSFVDRRLRRCATAWCPEHQAVVEGALYCRRHAALAARTIGSSQPTMAPDVDSRAAALCSWVAAHLDGRIRTAMRALLRPGRESIVVTPIRPVFSGPTRELAWEHCWKLNTHTGVTVGIVLVVSEARGDEVVVRVNREEVMRAVPPWIAVRRAGASLAADDDEKVRSDFYESLLRAVTASAYAHADDARAREQDPVRAWRTR